MEKIIFLLIVAFSATYYVNSKTVQAGTKFFRPSDTFERKVNELEQFLNKELNEASSKYEEWKTETKSYVNEQMSGGKRRIEERREEYVNQLRVLKEEAAENNVSIAECLSDEDALMALPADALLALIDCSNQTLAIMECIIDTGLHHVKHFLSLLTAAKRNFYVCKGKSFSLACIKDTLIGTLWDLGKAAANLPKEIVAVGRSIVDLKDLVKPCIEDNISRFSDDGSAILGNMTDCARGKFVD